MSADSDSYERHQEASCQSPLSIKSSALLSALLPVAGADGCGGEALRSCVLLRRCTQRQVKAHVSCIVWLGSWHVMITIKAFAIVLSASFQGEQDFALILQALTGFSILIRQAQEYLLVF